MLTVHRWDCSARACSRVVHDDLPATAADLPADDVVWVDLADPTPGEEQFVLERFLPVHPLTAADVTKPRREPKQGAHFSKVEEFLNYLFVVVNPLPPALLGSKAGAAAADRAPAANPAVALRRRNRPQLSAVLTKNVLVTHHYQPLECVDHVAAHLARHGQSASRGPDYLFHLVLDAMVDEYAPVVDRVTARLDRLETCVFRDPSPQALRRMLRLKRLASGLRKTLLLEREVLSRLVRGEFELVDQREIAYYRNVYDHLVRYTEMIESAREMASDLTQTHLSAASHRLNQVMKLLTMISTVILPMSLVSGIYGMNFEHMPELKWANGYYLALGVMAAIGVGAIAFFRWKRWM